MQRLKQKKIILFTLGLFGPLILTTSRVNAGSFGAETDDVEGDLLQSTAYKLAMRESL